MKRRTAVLAALVVALVVCMGVTPALAYFTDTTEANGGLVIGTKSTTHMDEEYADGVKHVTVEADAIESTTSSASSTFSTTAKPTVSPTESLRNLC